MPELDKGFEVFVNWQTALFCLAIYFATYVFRTSVEALVPNAKRKGTTAFHLWTELFLPLGPYGTGVIVALGAKKFPWPMPIADILSVKIMYGLVCGGASGWVYGRFRAWARVSDEKKKAGRASSGAQEQPPADSPADPPSGT